MHVLTTDSDYEMSTEDMTFIARTREDVPTLVAEIERLRGLVGRLLGTPDYYERETPPYHYDHARDDIFCVWCGERPGDPHETDCPFLEAEQLGLAH